MKDPPGQVRVKALVSLNLTAWCISDVLDLSGLANMNPQELLSNLDIEHYRNIRQLLLVQTGIHAHIGFDMGDRSVYQCA